MSDRLTRILTFLLALLLATAAILVGLMLTEGDPEPAPTTVVTSEVSPDSTPPSTENDRAPAGAAVPVKEWDEYYELVTGQAAVIPVPSEEDAVEISLTEDGFGLNRDWWIVSPGYVGPEGCRASARSLADDPVPLGILDISDGWYACVDVDGVSRFGQLRFLSIEPAGLVIVEVVIWNLAEEAGS